jgi:hypothetical protein
MEQNNIQSPESIRNENIITFTNFTEERERYSIRSIKNKNEKINSINEKGNPSSIFSPEKRTFVYLKFSLFLIFLVIVSLNSKFGFFNVKINFTKSNFHNCVYDAGFSLFRNVNIYLHSGIRDYFIIFSSFLVDLCILITCAHFALISTSCMFLINVALFYLPRGLVQQVYNMPFPSNYNFSYPGFPSISVPYGITNDFFWSGHVAIPLICGLEVYYNDYNKRRNLYFLLFCIFTSLFETLMMLSLSGHYTVDLIFGVIFSIYIFKLTNKLRKKFNNVEINKSQ